MAIGVGRAKRTQFNWVITGFAAVVNVALTILIPAYGIMGAVATVAVRRHVPRHDLVRAARLPGRTSGGASSAVAPLALLLVGRQLGASPRSLSLAYCARCWASSCPRSGAACWRGSAASRRAAR